MDPQQTVFYRIEKAIKSYRQFAQQQIAAVQSGITVDQLLILGLLDAEPDLAQKDLAKMLFKDHASITRMIELLVKRGHLLRSVHPEDRRKFKLAISTQGQQTLAQLKPTILRNRAHALQGIAPAELQQLTHILNKIINNCD
ncbi:MarR family winged helix-turn-helix transcriptional regulator [Marinicella meishanensis]|uniref:MarR family winged helix-turn-helix transcriptional regulator n=1 Tax=Marinicella meishanensis TaxID=2873263 RepID=UPI001CBD9EF3|nr:MarR family transcriptional regulator [Marinicella sp. NBU2979]